MYHLGSHLGDSSSSSNNNKTMIILVVVVKLIDTNKMYNTHITISIVVVLSIINEEIHDSREI